MAPREDRDPCLPHPFDSPVPGQGHTRADIGASARIVAWCLVLAVAILFAATCLAHRLAGGAQ